MGTWATLKTELEADIATGGWKTKSYLLAGRTVEYRDLNELMDFYDRVCALAANETSAYSGRTCARPARDT